MDLKSCSIGCDGALTVAQALSRHQALQHVSLRANDVEDDGMVSLGKVLQDHPSLTSVDLSYNGISNKGMESLLLNCNWKSLNLSNNKFDGAGARHLATLFAIPSGHSHQVEQKQCWTDTTTTSSEKVKPTAVEILGPSRSSSISLQSLDLAENKLGDSGAITIAELLKTNQSISTLNLSKCLINDAGAAAIAQSLQSHLMLAELNLENNYIGDDGAIAFAEELSSSSMAMSKLVSLNIGNYIKSSGTSALEEAAMKKSLEHLVINGGPAKVCKLFCFVY